MIPLDDKLAPRDDEYQREWEEEIAARLKHMDEGKAELLDWREAHEAIRRELREKRST